MTEFDRACSRTDPCRTCRRTPTSVFAVQIPGASSVSERRGRNQRMQKTDVLRMQRRRAGRALLAAACGSDNSSSPVAAPPPPPAAPPPRPPAAPPPQRRAAVRSAPASKCSGLALGFFGAYTGDELRPRHQRSTTAPSWPSTSSTRRTPTARSSYQTSTRRARPTRPRPLARSVVDDKAVVGVVGPAFSGESKDADPIFNEAGLPIITPSATERRRCRTTAGRSSTGMLANDAVQGPASPSTSRTR